MKSLNEVADDVRRTMARKASFAAAAETFHHAHVVKLVPSSAEIDEQQPGFYFKLILIFSSCHTFPLHPHSVLWIYDLKFFYFKKRESTPMRVYN